MPEALTYELQPRPEDLAAARHALRGWMTVSGVSSPSSDDLVAVASEFLLQAIAKAETSATIVLRAERAPEGVAISVVVATEAATGAGTAVTEVSGGGVVRPIRPLLAASDPLAPGGLGRRIVDAVCDDYELDAVEGRLTLRCWHSAS